MESLEPLYLFVFTHYPTQNRFALLLEMLLNFGARNGRTIQRKSCCYYGKHAGAWSSDSEAICRKGR
ncbi:hypothetical protein FIB18_18730 [Brucella pecoris]|uniref:Uncharacterized protein n=1 Tax=Brucella pecoris TaxID=867683 RepID=A0A5C5CF23_9HYPH|nr:hypothetical protein FIB18_18730 [Brucella pecoris]